MPNRGRNDLSRTSRPGPATRQPYRAFRILATTLYLAIIAHVTACDNQDRDTALPPRGGLILIIGPYESHPQWPGVRGGAERYAREIPYLTFEFVAPARDEQRAFEQVVDDAIARAPIAVCLYTTSPSRQRSACQRILDRGIPLVTMGTRIEGLRPYATVEVGIAQGAADLGSALPRLAADARSYLLLHEEGRDSIATACYQRFMASANRQHSLSLLEERNAARSADVPVELVRQMSARFQHAGLLVTLTPLPWSSQLPAELLGPRTRFATLGATPELWPHLQSGRAAALVGPLDGEVGHAAVALAVEGLSGKESPQAPRRIDCELVTRETLPDFARRYAAAAGMNLAELLP